LAFESVGYISEAFVFAYLGVSVLAVDWDQMPILFAFCMIIVIFFARFIATFSFPCINFLCRKNFNLKIKELKVVWYSGLIRGKNK
jgi:NhaP-type Na+/H+ or K+/H+ antiporter